MSNASDRTRAIRLKRRVDRTSASDYEQINRPGELSANGRHPGTLDTPMVGRFENAVGTFYANDTLAGRPIRVRFLWTLPKPDMPRWEQAFSADAGATWETNWVMEFTRRP
jgi:hypothetical protein